MKYVNYALMLGVIGGLLYVAQEAGWQLCLAFLVGYFWCYIQFKNWRFDH